MTAVIILIVIGLAVFAAVSGKKRGAGQKSAPVSGYVRCPTCGARARVRGNTWECGSCCDCGSVGNRRVYKNDTP